MAKGKFLDIKVQKNIAILRKTGISYREIARMTGFSLGAVQNAVKEFEEEIKISKTIEKEAELANYNARKDVSEFTPSDSTAALKVHRKAIRDYDKDSKLALAAADKTLDRIHGKPIQKNINENINIVATTDEILTMLHGEGIKI